MITVRKRDETGRMVWEYTGVVLERGKDFVRLEARFNRDDTPFQGIVLKRGDRFVETFYTERWYNQFEIHDRDDDALKGWYCNVGRPAVWEAPDTLSYVDLALDLWVRPDGTQAVLDEDEFDRLALDEATRHQALAALDELQKIFKSKQPPV
jgi:predicted RNA-binding protein associated with RNAse of E/G family